MNLNGEIVIVTGGVGLLGQEYCKAIQEIGGEPITLDIATDYIKSVGKAYHCDITIEENIEHILEYIKEDFPNQSIYGLINNAAIDPKFQKDSIQTNQSRLENYDLAQWNREIAVGLTGAFLCTKHFAPEMARHGRGSIINISSVLGLIAPNQALYADPGAIGGYPTDEQVVKPVTYSVLKHAIIGLTRYTATYYGNKGVRCNALAPGGVFNNHSEEFVQKLSKLIPLSKMADKTSYNEAIKFLLTDASAYMTGATLVMDGGMSAW